MFCGLTQGDHAMGMPFQRQLDQLFRGKRSIWLKVGGGVLVALYLTLQSFWRNAKGADRATAVRVTLVGLVVAGIAGALIALFLAMKDRMKERLARGERVNLLARAYLGMGIWSLLLWCPTIFFLGILLIILTH
jgi:hypothetical protein